MAESGYEKLGKARRRVIRRDKKTRTVSGGLDFLAEGLENLAGAVIFGKGQMKKQDTAWKEYEAGYEALAEPVRAAGGDVAAIPKRGGFWKQAGQTLFPGGDKGFYEMPEGDVTIDKKTYDREKIQEAGAFLGTDAAAALYSQKGGDEARTRYLKRVVPGKLAPGLGTAPATEPRLIFPELSDTTIADFRDPSESLQQWSVGGIGAQDYLQQDMVATGPQIPDQNLPIPNMNFYERKKYNLWNRLSEKYGSQRGEYDPQTGNWNENYPDDNGQYDKNYMEALDRNRNLHSWRK